MPHCIIDYSQDITVQVDIDRLIEAVHLGAMDSGLFHEYDIKTRALAFTHHRTVIKQALVERRAPNTACSCFLTERKMVGVKQAQGFFGKIF